MKRRSQAEVVAQCEALRRAAELDPWAGEALGTLLWSLQLAELPPYDQPFTSEVLAEPAGEPALRPADETEREREEARLWHWRARTSDLLANDLLALPEQFATADQLIAATAMRGNERGLLPAPTRGDFRAFGKVYRHLSPEQLAEAHAIAAERQHALNWLAGLGETWDDVPLDT